MTIENDQKGQNDCTFFVAGACSGGCLAKDRIENLKDIQVEEPKRHKELSKTTKVKAKKSGCPYANNL